MDIIVSRINKPRPMEVHASDVDGLCLLKPYYRRVIQPPLPLSDLSSLFLMRGLAIERYMVEGGPPSPIQKDGIWCSIDDVLDVGPVEIKSTVKSERNFHPIDTYPHWTTRIKTYCYAYETNTFHLSVYFLMGDYRDVRTSLRSYTLEFSDSELQENWGLIQERKKILEHMWETNEVISPDMVDAYHEQQRGRSRYWQCEQCELKEVCYFHNKCLMENDNGKLERVQAEFTSEG